MSQFAIRKPSIEALREAPIYFRYGSHRKRVLVDAFTASAVLAVYDATNETNREKIARMVAGSFGHFQKVVGVCFKFCGASTQ